MRKQRLDDETVAAVLGVIAEAVLDLDREIKPGSRFYVAHRVRGPHPDLDAMRPDQRESALELLRLFRVRVDRLDGAGRD